jgi:isopropylmalate/homocitrate/citramalate synthase
MTDLPKFVEFHEEGPREGFQIEPVSYPLNRRAALIDSLSETGLKQIQVGSFVSPKVVPTMADTAELFGAIKRRDGVEYTALWLNKKGFMLAGEAPRVHMDTRLLFYTTDAFSQANNNCSATEMRDRQAEWLDLYLQQGLAPASAYIMTAFGCNFGGPVPIGAVTDLVQWIIDLCAARDVPLPVIYLADTVGWANPEDMKRRIGMVRELAPEARIGLHLHDTRGLGAANVYAALQMGVDLFDASVAGLGGCPFAGHGSARSAGNICTEDMVFLCQEMGIDTGIDLDALIDSALLAEDIIGRPLNGRIMHAGSLARYRPGP